MNKQLRSGGSPSLSSEALVCGHDSTAARAGVSVNHTTPSISSTQSYGSSTSATRPRRSWDTAFQNNRNDAGTGISSRPRPTNSRGAWGVPAEEATTAAAAADAGYSGTSSTTSEAALRGGQDATGMPATNGAPGDSNDGSPADGGPSCRSSKTGAVDAASFSPRTPRSPAFTSARGAAGSDDDLTDNDEGVMARLTEFTDIARRTAIQNEELSRELAAEKRRVVQTTRKLEQSNMTSMELRESLALAQETVMRLREHEMAWAERTASEMSLRSEMCAVKDDLSRVSVDNAALKKRCDMLQRENAELGERFAAMAEEKRQVESKARRLLRSDRYRGY